MDTLPSLGVWGMAIPATLFAIIAGFELLRPRRNVDIKRKTRWITHAGFFLTNMATARLMAFLVAIPIAANMAAQHNFGLFNIIELPIWAEILLTFIIMDFAVWFQHYIMHKNDFLWRMHKVHHSDRHLDATTALRFHPVELIISTLYKSIWVALLGVPAIIALCFELWLNGNALFNHSNIALPKWVDSKLRLFLVTPNMHLVHHSIDRSEHDRNFGFALTIWDRVFKQYLPESKQGLHHQKIGLQEAQNEKPESFFWSMLFPFRNVK